MEIFRFKNWNVYKDAKQFFALVLRYEIVQLCYGISKQSGGFKRKIAEQAVIGHKL